MYDLIKKFTFQLPTRIEFEIGITSQLKQELKSLKTDRALIVTDSGIKKAGILNHPLKILENQNITYQVFDEVEPNPKDYNVKKGAEVARKNNIDTIIALGGGSPIDCAKAIAVLLAHDSKKIKNFAGKNKVKKTVPPLITIPTTAGTGSEITFSSVITDTDNNYKMTVKSPLLAPEVALLDPELTVTLPESVTASTGLDALTHAIEAYTATTAEPISNALALYAIELISNSITTAVFNGSNLKGRSGMLMGSLLAGIAFSNSDVASVHCLAEAMGGVYDIPHGICNSILLPYVMEYNKEYSIDKFARIARKMGETFDNNEKGAEKAIEKVKKISRKVNLPAFRELEINPDDFDLLAEMAASNISTESNPREMNENDYLNILKNAYKN
ncbi:MAG: iron-containing alcohol dehydrogenase [Bacillota bacterium]